MNNQTGYRPLLADSRFVALLSTQFLGACAGIAFWTVASSCLANLRAGAVFVLPFLLFAGFAGQLADRFSKTRVIQTTKAFEAGVMLLGVVALMSGRSDLLVTVLFLLAAQVSFFYPAMYGILPEISAEANLSRANALLQLLTFAAIIIGATFASQLHGLALLGIAALGALCSLHVQTVPAARPREPFHLNPFHEIFAGAREIAKQPTLALSVGMLAWFCFIATLLSDDKVPLAIGIGLGSVAAGVLSGDRVEPGLVPAGAFLMGIFGIIFGLTANHTHALWSLTGLGFAAGLLTVPLSARLQANARAQVKGRILAASNFANVIAILAAIAALRLLPRNPSALILAAGIFTLIGSFAIVAVLPLATFRYAMRCLINILFRIEVQGAENVPSEGAALLVANHVTYADALLVGLSTPRTARFMMRRIYYNVPVARHFFRMLQAIPVETTTPRAITLALRDAHDLLQQGCLVAIFPEGHITLDGEIKEFKRGYERMVRDLPVPIVPIGIHGLWGHPFSCKGGDAFRSWEHLWRPRVTVRVGAPVWGPISPEELRRIVVDLARPQAARAATAP